jgi:hypothetical protein
MQRPFAYAQLEDVDDMPGYSRHVVTIFLIVHCIRFCIMIGFKVNGIVAANKDDDLLCVSFLFTTAKGAKMDIFGSSDFKLQSWNADSLNNDTAICIKVVDTDMSTTPPEEREEDYDHLLKLYYTLKSELEQEGMI